MRYIRGNVEREAGTKEMCSRLEAEGFKKVIPEQQAEGQSPEEETIPLEQMSAVQLKEYAKSKGIEGANSLTKAELLAVLKEVD
ncbi:Rho termination factor N-terminal domain-containing protein [Enterocloster sp. HCN-30185]|jgi:hypothetical protein|uniref:Rho termination factor N-terminal domain-containing protein n=1 Tax=Enterocloster sp. HCN-30185 TaxID=3134663 RepID=UPI0030BE79CA